MSLPVIYEEARTAQSCIDWHKHCNAECCRQFVIGTKIDHELKKGDVLHLGMRMTPDTKWYYELHGVKVAHGQIHIKLDDFTYTNGRLTIHRKCDKLTEDNRCSGHPNNKPNICKGFTIETARGEQRGLITPNCLFKYKIEAENHGTNETSKTDSNGETSVQP